MLESLEFSKRMSIDKPPSAQERIDELTYIAVELATDEKYLAGNGLDPINSAISNFVRPINMLLESGRESYGWEKPRGESIKDNIEVLRGKNIMIIGGGSLSDNDIPINNITDVRLVEHVRPWGPRLAGFVANQTINIDIGDADPNDVNLYTHIKGSMESVFFAKKSKTAMRALAQILGAHKTEKLDYVEIRGMLDPLNPSDLLFKNQQINLRAVRDQAQTNMQNGASYQRFIKLRTEAFINLQTAVEPYLAENAIFSFESQIYLIYRGGEFILIRSKES